MRQLRPYQLEAVQRLVQNDPNLYINFMCGLGKSVTAIEAVKALWARATPEKRKRKNSLVLISPKVAVAQWVKELESQHPSAAIVVLGDTVDAVYLGDRTGHFIWTVTHHETLLNPHYFAGMVKTEWFAIIADEAHKFNNRNAQRTVALKKLHADYKLALSGTKLEKSIADVWSILNWFDRKRFSSYWDFYGKFIVDVPAPVGRDTPYDAYRTPKEIVGIKNREELTPLLRRYVLRKTRAQVAPELPKKIVQVVTVPLGTAQRRTYDTIRTADDILVALPHYPVRSAANEGLSASTNGGRVTLPYTELVIANPITRLMRLQQAASMPGALLGVQGVPSAKLEWILAYIANNLDEQIIVFTRFRETAIATAIAINDTLGEKPTERSPGRRAAALVVGARPPEGLDDFLAGNLQVLVGTIAAMGTALDLVMARTAIFMELEWSTIQMRQAADRNHRMTSTVSPNLIFLIAEHTVDAGILDAITNKLQVDAYVDRILGTTMDSDAVHIETDEQALAKTLEEEDA